MKKHNGISRQMAVGSRQSAVYSRRYADGSTQFAVRSLQDTVDKLPTADCKELLTADCLLPTAHYKELPTAYCKLPTAHCLLLTAYCLLILLFTNCFQPESGCLDIEATNFDITADEPCGGGDDSANGCPCTYPDFSFRTEYLFDKATYSDGTIYQVEGQFIQIEDIQFYLSDFAFRYTSGDWTQVADTISVTIENETGFKDTVLTDDFVLVNQQSTFEIGAIQQSGEFDSLRFIVGISDPANTVNPDSVNRTRHSLTETEMHTNENGYIFSQFVFYKDTLETTLPTTLNISQKAGNGKIVPIQMPISAKSSVGSNFFVGTLVINHAKWFDGIKFVTDSDEVMIEKIVANTPNVFSISN